MFNLKELFKHKNGFYIFENPTLREEIINKYYNIFSRIISALRRRISYLLANIIKMKT